MLTWAEIDLNAISYNLRQIKSLIEPKGVGIMAVVKDNAYGHGAVEVAKVASGIPVSMIGVATVEEAIELRQAGINLPILIFCCILPEYAEEIVKNEIIQTVSGLEICQELSKLADRYGKQVKVHVKVDTGMGRIGICYDKAVQLIEQILNLPLIKIDGIFTHFAVAETDEGFTGLQIERFKSVISTLEEKGINIPFKHTANSAGILGFPESYFNMVRPGISIYGLYPSPVMPRVVELKPALSLKTRVVYLKEIPTGWSVSYGRTYTAKNPTKVATLAIGYGKGYGRKLSNKGEVLIRGVRASIIGTICMDQCLCDVTHIPDVTVGDEVVLIGKQGDQEITADEVAEKAETISYEILCGISESVPRVYR